VPRAVATALGIPEQPRRPLPEVLADALRPRRLLLVLDNCEHLIVACARLADLLLRSCPDLRLLATSREVLGIAGEIDWRVPSLTLAEGRTDMTRDRAAASEAVRLFVLRACAALPALA
jgi:predicted ATPase